ncbi:MULTISPECIES: YtpI family protein [Bacillaceae]|jgi:YtpI-like protein|uniref:YtpI family protein n=1 Tax=Metabacillus hrfriensis TaxID=3048891 RepID=A0ACD4R8N3_9BACI|nr:MULTISPECIES: YtpI family protein [Bacillaceae]UOK57237.1 YtpI family protein [Bacillus sp. OVS6]USK27590.1 YtpI family protein [Bacillus sp. CMF21]MDQ0858098.1 glucan phosphoethanolaminetransferase (alkaline phosphatase superfamily) [Bacillus sp. V2I10]UAL51294.1 YtpI family protein [Metabacillus dongyingensis]WHZ56801.1 YtpI family protein [Metabacillus sp. CT-WN-B3]
MPVFVILIIFAFSFYLFYKVKFYRTKKPMEKQWLSAKSSIALGIFVFFFGLNQLFLFHSTVSLVVGIIFMIVGLASSWAGYKAYKHYLPFAVKESKQG